MSPQPTASYSLAEIKNDTFKRQLSFLKESQFWSHEELQRYQLGQLKELLAHCSLHVPYYRNVFRQTGISLNDFNSLADIKLLPFTDKETIKYQPEDFIDERADQTKLVYMTTGGSTGDPLKILMDLTYKALTLAGTYYYMDLAGLNPEDFRSVRLHGDTLEQEIIDQGRYWRLDEDRRLVMSAHHVFSDTAPLYLEAMDNHKPVYLHGYPSAVALLASYFDEQGLKPTQPVQAIFCDSEVLYDSQRQLIEKVFGGRVYSVYGHTEGSVLGVNCAQSRKMHLVPQVGICELLDADDKPITQLGQKGQIVVTGFYNRVMPFVRYRTYDVGVYSEQSCACGRNYFILEQVEGRAQDYGVDSHGRAVPLAPTLFDYNFDWSGIDRFRVVQKAPGKLNFLIVPDAAAKDQFPQLAARIKNSFENLFNYGFKIDVERKDSLARTDRGKYRYLDQRLPMKDFF